MGIQRTTSQCEKAAAQVIASLDKRRAENTALKEQLLCQHRESNQTVLDAEELIRRLRMAQIVAGSSSGADAAQPSEAELKAAEEKWAELQKAEAALEELRAAKKLIEDDIRRKTAAMKIDESCKILRPVAVDLRPPEDRDAYRMPKSVSVPSSPKQRGPEGLSIDIEACS